MISEELGGHDASSASVVFAVALCTGAAGAYLGDRAVNALWSQGGP
ncbi:hypothetical protein [Ramlibacter sp.]|nr:hypothetical protein [Ramlibacter sp.]MDB5956402.1 hypothetical protein [Ramlibacter sp.]